MNILVDVIILFVVPPLLPGIIARTKAIFAGRKGMPLLQGYFDIWKLLRKGMVLSHTTTPLFILGPLVSLVALLGAGLFVPLASRESLLPFEGDFLVFVGLCALGRFASALAALDTGSSFEGMGAARDICYASFAEMGWFFVFLVLAKVSGSLMLQDMLAFPLVNTTSLHGPAVLLVVLAVCAGVLLETCRIPFDDPNTHLELTMIHEVMVLDHSGPIFGLIEYTAAVKLLIFESILVHTMVLYPAEKSWSASLLVLIGLFTCSIAIGIIESVIARFRLALIPTILVSASILSAFGFLFVMR